MKQYPKLFYWKPEDLGKYHWCFDKLDGSNLRFEWERKRGWYKYGTRNTMISGIAHPYYEAIELFQNKYADKLERIFIDNKNYRGIKSMVVFCEYVGPKSFAGYHSPGDKKDIILFDVNQYKKGFVLPRQFVEDFQEVGIPNIVYQGIINEDLIEAILDNEYNLSEGIIMKRSEDNKIIMRKAKTRKWLETVKSKLGERALIEDLDGEKRFIEVFLKS